MVGVGTIYFREERVVKKMFRILNRVLGRAVDTLDVLLNGQSRELNIDIDDRTGNMGWRVGRYLFGEPDWWQLLLWCGKLQKSPHEMMAILCELTKDLTTLSWFRGFRGNSYETHSFHLSIDNGHFRVLVWDTELLPLKSFEWLPGLYIDTLVIHGTMPEWPADQKLPSLKRLIVSELNLQSLDLTPVPGLEELHCQGNQLTHLDLRPVPRLKVLDCAGNGLTHLNLTSVPGLTKLNCGGNELTELDLTPVPGLTKLDCWRNELTELDLTPVLGLTMLFCSENQLTELDLTPVPGLTMLFCSENQLTELDLTPVPGLTMLDCRKNPLTELDLRPVPNLDFEVDDHVRIIGRDTRK